MRTERVQCPECYGTGKVFPDSDHPCGGCWGKGYIERTIYSSPPKQTKRRPPQGRNARRQAKGRRGKGGGNPLGALLGVGFVGFIFISLVAGSGDDAPRSASDRDGVVTRPQQQQAISVEHRQRASRDQRRSEPSTRPQTALEHTSSTASNGTPQQDSPRGLIAERQRIRDFQRMNSMREVAVTFEPQAHGCAGTDPFERTMPRCGAIPGFASMYSARS